MGALFLTDVGADTVKPTLNPFEKISPQKMGRKQLMGCEDFYKLRKNYVSTKNTWCVWHSAWVYKSAKEPKSARVVLEGCSDWKKPKLASSIHPSRGNALYPDFLPKQLSGLLQKAIQVYAYICPVQTLGLLRLRVRDQVKWMVMSSKQRQQPPDHLSVFHWYCFSQGK